MKRLSLILLVTLACFSSHATHIAGGGFNLTWLHDSTYRLELRVLRDCRHGIPTFDSSLHVGMFNRATHQRLRIEVLTLDSTSSLPFDTSACNRTDTSQCQETAYYNKTITLSPTSLNVAEGYYFSWERCCRPDGIKNLRGADTSGITFYLEIPSPDLIIINSSPKWNLPLKKVLCQNEAFTYNFDFTDADNDSLSYRLVPPLTGNLGPMNPMNMGNPQAGPYARAAWSTGYDSAHHIKGTPGLSLNRLTGTVNVQPDSTGTFASAISVEEFRGGVKIGETRLELQYYVAAIQPNTSVHEYTNRKPATISPNPGSHISIDLGDMRDAEEFILLGLDGRIMLSRKIHSLRNPEIDAGQLTPGIYFYMLRNSERSLQTGKLVLTP